MSLGKKSVRRVKVDDQMADVEVSIHIMEGHIMKTHEVQHLADHLASEAMKMVAAAPYISCPLSKIKVSCR